MNLPATSILTAKYAVNTKEGKDIQKQIDEINEKIADGGLRVLTIERNPNSYNPTKEVFDSLVDYDAILFKTTDEEGLIYLFFKTSNNTTDSYYQFVNFDYTYDDNYLYCNTVIYYTTVSGVHHTYYPFSCYLPSIPNNKYYKHSVQFVYNQETQTLTYYSSSDSRINAYQLNNIASTGSYYYQPGDEYCKILAVEISSDIIYLTFYSNAESDFMLIEIDLSLQTTVDTITQM